MGIVDICKLRTSCAGVLVVAVGRQRDWQKLSIDSGYKSLSRTRVKSSVGLPRCCEKGVQRGGARSLQGCPKKCLPAQSRDRASARADERPASHCALFLRPRRRPRAFPASRRVNLQGFYLRVTTSARPQ